MTLTPEEYKDAQKKRMSDLKIGAKDPNGYIITKIFGRGDEFVIYEIQTNDLVDSLKVYIDTQLENNDVPLNNYNAVREQLAKARGVLYKAVDKNATKAQIAPIIVTGIKGDAVTANNLFKELIETINSDYREQFNNRMRLLILPMVFSLIIVVYAYLTYFYGYFTYVGYYHIRNIIFVTAGGCVGGFFSISIGVNKLVCERDVVPWLYVLYGLERITIAVLAAVIVYFAIKIEFIFSVCEKMHSPLTGYVFFSIVSGFSETLVPNLLIKVEKGP